MTITTPRTFPAVRFNEAAFEVSHQVAAAPESGGRYATAQLGEPRWAGSWSLQTVNEEEVGKWRAWLSSLRMGGRMFYGFDPWRRLPLAHKIGILDLIRAGGGAFNGTATSWSVSSERDVVTLNGLPVSLRLQHSDYIGFSWDTSKRSLHRVLSDASANGSGVGVWDIEPPVASWVDAGAVATVYRPDCAMKLTEPPRIQPVGKLVTISFSAQQHLEP